MQRGLEARQVPEPRSELSITNQPQESVMRLNPYLFFNGQCEAAFKFYAKVLGARIEAMITHDGTPAAEQVSPEWRSKIMHAHLVIGDKVLMASDAPPDRSEGAMKGFSVNLGI